MSENREADMRVIELFDPDTLDVIVLTSYSHSLAGVNRPTDIPGDYYKSVSDLVSGKPLGFSEIMWPSTSEFGGEKAQSDFIELLVDGLSQDQGIDLEFVMWPWLHDLSESDNTGLLDHTGLEKLGYSKWVEVSER